MKLKHLSPKFVLLLMLTLALVVGSVRVSVQAMSSHAPILIDGDANFTPANGVTGGSGTALDPYIIEGWDINAATANGIEIRNTRAYFIIRNTTIHDGKPNNYQAISFQNVTYGIVINVTSTNNVGLILMTEVSNSKVLNNTALDDGRIGLDSESHHNTIAFNYLWSPSRPYPEGASCIWLEGDYNDVIGNTLINFGNGISIGSNGDFNNIINNEVSNGQWYAINCDGNNTTVEGNEVSGGVRGISFAGFGNNITGNYAHDNSEGMYCGRYSSGVSIVGNIIVDNYYGISFGEEPASGELIYNNYLYNSINAYDIGTNNWNTSKTMGTNILGGPYLGGNYYSDYTGTDADGDGIGDTPYSIPGGSNIDYLPLVPDITPPTITTILPSNTTYTTTLIQLNFTVNEATSWIGYSLDRQANVTITGNTTLTLSEGSHNIVVYANDTVGNMGSSLRVYFTVDATPPAITEVSQTPPKNSVLPNDEVKINATVTDALSEVKKVTLVYAYANRSGIWVRVVDMTNLKGSIWNATIPAFSYGTNVTYIIIAEDNAGNTITSEQLGYECKYQVIPEFPSVIILPLFVVLTMFAVVFAKRKIPRKLET